MTTELRSRWGSVELRRLAADSLVEQAKFVKTLRILSLRLRFEGEDRSGTRGTTGGKALGATPKARTPVPPPKAPPVRREEAPKEEEFEEVVEHEEERESDIESEYSYESSEAQGVVDDWQEASDKRVDRTPVKSRKSSGSAEVEGEKKKRQYSEEVRELPVSGKKEKKVEKAKPVESGSRHRTRGRRGGTKHQQSSKRRHDPSARIHRKRSVKKLIELKAQDKASSPREKECRR